MRINLASVLVDDQDRAERFYTEVLGFQKAFFSPREGRPFGSFLRARETLRRSPTAAQALPSCARRGRFDQRLIT